MAPGELQSLSRLLYVLALAISVLVVAVVVVLYRCRGTQTIQVSGILEPKNIAYVRAPSGGRIVDVRGTFDRPVQGGDTLFVLDGIEWEGKMSAARGRLAIARARREENGLTIEILLNAHALRVQKARVECEYARQELREYVVNELVNRNYHTSDTLVLHTPPEISRLDSYRRHVLGVRVAEASAQLVVSDTLEIQRLRGELVTLDMEIQSSLEELGRLQSGSQQMVIRAPVDGLVLAYELGTRLNEYVDGGELLCAISRCDAWQVRCQVTEHAIPLIACGTRARIRLNSHCPKNDFYEGRVISVSSAPRIQQGMGDSERSVARRPEYALVIEFDEYGRSPDCPDFRYGLLASAHIALQRRSLHDLIVKKLLRTG